MFASLRRRLPRLGRFPRLCAVGCCLLLAAQSAASRANGRGAAPNVPRGPLVVAVRALASGHLLGQADVRVVDWPRSLRPASARARPSEVVGRRLAGPVAAGEPLTGPRLLGPELTAGLPPGLVAAAVPVADGHAIDLVRPGERVDVLSTQRTDGLAGSAAGGPVTTVARAARALAVFADGPAGGAEIVLALSRSAAAAVTRDSGSHVFTVVLTPP